MSSPLAQAANTVAYEANDTPKFGDSLQHVNTPDDLRFIVQQASHPVLRRLALAAKGAAVGGGIGMMTGSLPGAVAGALVGGGLGAFGGGKYDQYKKQQAAIAANQQDKVAMSNNAVYNRDTDTMQKQLRQEYLERYGQEPGDSEIKLTATNAKERDKQATALHNQIKEYKLRENYETGQTLSRQTTQRQKDAQTEPTMSPPGQAPVKPGTQVTKKTMPKGKPGSTTNPVKGSVTAQAPVPPQQVAQLPENTHIDPLHAPPNAFVPATLQAGLQEAANKTAANPSEVYRNIGSGQLSREQAATEPYKRESLAGQARASNAKASVDEVTAVHQGRLLESMIQRNLADAKRSSSPTRMQESLQLLDQLHASHQIDDLGYNAIKTGLASGKQGQISYNVYHNPKEHYKVYNDGSVWITDPAGNPVRKANEGTDYFRATYITGGAE